MPQQPFAARQRIRPANGRWEEILNPPSKAKGTGTRLLGAVIVVGAVLTFIGGVYAAVISKQFPLATQEDGIACSSGPAWVAAALDAVQRDRHYCILVPLVVPATVGFAYVNWLCFEFFRNI